MADSLRGPRRLVEDEPPPIWTQKLGESGRAYAAFSQFRDLEPETRSLRAAYEQQTGIRGAKQASGRWNTWAATWGWRDRARAWDEEQDRQYLATRQRERRRLRDRKAQVARLLQNRALLRLNELDPHGLSQADVTKWLELGFRLESEALGDDVSTPEGLAIARQEQEDYVTRLHRLRRERELRALEPDDGWEAGSA